MKEIFKLKRLYLLLFFPLSFALIFFARQSSGWIEHFYIPFIYKPLSFVVGTVISVFPFSVSEILAVLLFGLATVHIVKNIKKPLVLLVNFLCAIAVSLFLFEICMGLNYYRTEAKQYFDFTVKGGTKEGLYQLCEILAHDMNENRKLCQTDGQGVLVLSDKNIKGTCKAAKEAYNTLSEKYTFLKAADIRNKPLLSSKLFSRFMTTGIYIPFTFESNINVDVPKHTIPATMCHELTHFRGFMRENEANFIGYLACMMSERPDFKYSASLMAFEYAFPKLYKEDKELASKISLMVDDGVRLDIAAEDEYWDKYQDTVISEVSDKVYNSYLGANGQTSGIKSYGEMVDLLLAYYGIE